MEDLTIDLNDDGPKKTSEPVDSKTGTGFTAATSTQTSPNKWDTIIRFGSGLGECAGGTANRLIFPRVSIHIYPAMKASGPIVTAFTYLNTHQIILKGAILGLSFLCLVCLLSSTYTMSGFFTVGLHTMMESYYSTLENDHGLWTLNGSYGTDWYMHAIEKIGLQNSQIHPPSVTFLLLVIVSMSLTTALTLAVPLLLNRTLFSCLMIDCAFHLVAFVLYFLSSLILLCSNDDNHWFTGGWIFTGIFALFTSIAHALHAIVSFLESYKKRLGF